jgi:ribosomal-protein-alanine N-acetyltransferase
MTPTLRGGTVELVPFRVEDIDDTYISWLNDPRVNCFLEVRHVVQTRETTSAFVQSFYGDAEQYIWRVLYVDSGSWIGTATTYNIDRTHRYGEIGLLIGDCSFWGQGISREVIGLQLDFAFGPLGLRKITAGTYARNIAMNRGCELLGFSREGILRQQYQLRGEEYVDGYRWGLLAHEWRGAPRSSVPAEGTG